MKLFTVTSILGLIAAFSTAQAQTTTPRCGPGEIKVSEGTATFQGEGAGATEAIAEDNAVDDSNDKVDVEIALQSTTCLAGGSGRHFYTGDKTDATEPADTAEDGLGGWIASTIFDASQEWICCEDE